MIERIININEKEIEVQIIMILNSLICKLINYYKKRRRKWMIIVLEINKHKKEKEIKVNMIEVRTKQIINVSP